MGSLEALELYWTSVPVLAILTAFLLVALALAALYRTPAGRTRLPLLRAALWLDIAFWTFVAASIAFCISIADPVEYDVTTAKVVAILSIGLGIGMSTVVAAAIARGVPVRARDLPPGGWLPAGDPLRERVKLLGAAFGLAGVRVRLVTGPPLARAEPPDALVVSDELLRALTGEEVDAVLLHELGHFAEADGIEKAFTGTMRRFLAFDPFVQILHRASSREREFHADALAAKKMGGGGPLASALRKLAPFHDPASRLAWHPRIEDRVARLGP